MSLTGIILAGGKSSRLGFNKIKIKIGPVPLFISQILKLSLFCDEVIVSSSSENYNILLKELDFIKKYHEFLYDSSNKIEIPDLSLIVDDTDIKYCKEDEKPGPLLGIYSGLKKAKNQYCLAVGFDMPFISYNLIDNIVKIKDRLALDSKRGRDIIAINTTKGFEALCSIYSKSCTETIRSYLKSGRYKISDIFSKLEAEIIIQEELNRLNIDELNFFNINTSADFEAFKNIWKERNPKDDFLSKWKKMFYR